MEYEKNRILVSIEDNTNEIISRKQMLQHNKMIAVGQLAAGFAHEIRNPLGIIRNYCYVLKSKLTNQDQLIDKSISSNLLSNAADAVLRITKHNRKTGCSKRGRNHKKGGSAGFKNIQTWRKQ